MAASGTVVVGHRPGSPAIATPLVPPEVVLYCAPDCVWCTAARDFLVQHHVPFSVIDVYENRDKWRAARRLTGRSGLPIIIVGGQAVVGFERDELAALLGLTLDPPPAGEPTPRPE